MMQPRHNQLVDQLSTPMKMWWVGSLLIIEIGIFILEVWSGIDTIFPTKFRCSLHTLPLCKGAEKLEGWRLRFGESNQGICNRRQYFTQQSTNSCWMMCVHTKFGSSRNRWQIKMKKAGLKLCVAASETRNIRVCNPIWHWGSWKTNLVWV